MDDIEKKIESIKRKIHVIATKSERNPSDITLVAVSKTKNVESLKSAFKAHQRDFGENYVQEFVTKYTQLKDLGLRWHFIGHLQSNKAKDVVGKIFLLHTLDSLKLAQTIDKVCVEKNCVQKCLVQVNISGEEKKSGCDPENIFSFIAELNFFKKIEITGLMMIGTHTDDLDKIRGEFRKLRKLRDEINSRQIYRNPLSELSMGMSGQFKSAIEEGATLIRLGTQIFGFRK